MNRLVLVTGGAGFIGSHLVDRLIKDGYRVRVVDNFSTGRLENLKHLEDNPNLEVMRGDLKNEQDAREAVKGADAVFHFAANPEVRVSSISPRVHFEENVVATFNLLEAMREYKVKEMVFASSSSVYGEPEEIPVDENAPVRPVSVYGASKAACENLIHAYSKLYGIRAVILRYANIIGPRLRHGVIYDLLMKLKKNLDELEVLGDGTQVRSYLYVDDAVEATIIAWRLSNGNYEVYNVGNEDWVTVNDVMNIILNELGLSNVKIVHRPVLHGVGWLGDVKRIALKIDRLKTLGFKPSTLSRGAISMTVKALVRELGFV
ncbi:SDR family NAD(P)-dependent oxidoreductase [Vulcanisaeta distributa]|uniref:NAD-dependent epimerase/dehydratase n=1 Tax=Vulcanisaeta distributa (strain DSM 14429 / JCM 11212 / NBRC 100878 / IC-017) TaxID=572478 RepID=E1QUD0_VULDI|nr:SDR family NAD(P)-dependent oxidoreductase [Vulcanisaeta distributa]ADN49856.1 NAD-dependent epimerase/dehydratase [Vulcanisaeta distributa DSM 14429]